jgi:hypothetical protein
VEVLLGKDELRAELGEAARAYAATFSWATTAAAFADFLGIPDRRRGRVPDPVHAPG